MARYKIEFVRSVKKDLRKIAREDVGRILKSINRLANEPRPDSSKKLTNEELHRLRAGTYRVIYEIFDARLVVLIVKVGHRKSIYRN